MENLFDTGGIEQLLLIKPYIKKMKNFKPSLDDEDTLDSYIDLFRNQMNSIIGIRGELEELPEWVIDKEDYVMKSEIKFCVCLYGAVLSRKEFSKEHNPIYEDMGLEEIDTISSNSSDEAKIDRARYFIKLLIKLDKEINDIGEYREWDMSLFNLQLSKLMEKPLVRNPFDSYIFSTIRQGIDYN